MPAEQLIMRMISSLGQIDNKKLSTGKLENDDWKRFNEAISILADTNVFFMMLVVLLHLKLKQSVEDLLLKGRA